MQWVRQNNTSAELALRRDLHALSLPSLGGANDTLSPSIPEGFGRLSLPIASEGEGGVDARASVVEGVFAITSAGMTLGADGVASAKKAGRRRTNR